MAVRKKRGGGAAGGLKGGALTVVMFLVIAGAVVGWWNTNGFTSFGDVIDWFKQKSASLDACVDGHLPDGTAASDFRNLWNAHNCATPLPSGSADIQANAIAIENVEGPEALTALLDSIAVAPEKKVEYKRSDWRHWSDLDNNGCDTREDILQRDGTDVKTDPKTCKVLSGKWTEQYGPTTVTNGGDLDIDHIVPLSWAARNGGQDWDASIKEQFANDPDNLFVSIAKENRSKGDKGPADYLPPNQDFICEYTASFVKVVYKYQLTIPQNEKSAASGAIKKYC